MFTSTSLAARIDRAEARLTESAGHSLRRLKPGGRVLVARIGGGVAVFTGPASPMNKMIGVGFDDLPSDGELQAVEDEFADRGAPLQAEVSTLADPALVARLARRGYIPQGFENVLGRRIGPDGDDRHDTGAIAVRLIREDEAAAWLDVTVTSFLHADLEGVQAEPLPPREAIEETLREFMNVPGFLRYGALIDGQLVGAASLRLDDGLAQLCGAGTLPLWRRRGVQSALLRRRLADARDAGCDLALLTTSPGTRSQENGHRQGFALLYCRALLVRQ